MGLSDVPEGVKMCSKCGEIKKVSQFHMDKGTKSGLRSACKTCLNAARHLAHIKNKRADLEKANEYYHQNKEKILSNYKVHYSENSELIQVRNKVHWLEEVLLEPEFGLLTL